MAALKKIFSFTLKYSVGARSISTNQLSIFKQNGKISQLSFGNTQIRCISFYPLAKNMQYVSNDKNLDISVDQKTMKLNKPINKPLCYMFTWLNAKNDHITRYANIYLDKGFDIFNVVCTPFQALIPLWGTQPVARNFLKFMEQNNSSFNPIVMQGFSIAGYMWGEICKYASQDLPRYQPLIDNIICQTWDSVPDLTEFSVGIARGQFPHSKIMQAILGTYASLHLKMFYYPATRHYITSSKHMHDNLLMAPALFLVSKTDPVGEWKSNQAFKASWEKKGIKVSWKGFEVSPHVQHIHTHPEEYVEAVNNHLKANVPMLKDCNF